MNVQELKTAARDNAVSRGHRLGRFREREAAAGTEWWVRCRNEGCAVVVEIRPWDRDNPWAIVSPVDSFDCPVKRPRNTRAIEFLHMHRLEGDTLFAPTAAKAMIGKHFEPNPFSTASLACTITDAKLSEDGRSLMLTLEVEVDG